ncbi:FAD dependent oxidoreductase [Meredithblackwellia eburnea MCA 4105]
MSRLARSRYSFLPPSEAVDHLVVGAGVVGLAIAERLTLRFPSLSTFVVERHGQAGQETSSRNSEVIHSGIYYPPASLKSRLCIRGRDLIYQRPNLPLKNTGKLIVATSEDEVAYLDKLLKIGEEVKRISGGAREVPLELVAKEKVFEMEPDVRGSKVIAALWSPRTGIVDSHGLMSSLERGIMEEGDGMIAYGTKVVRIDKAEHEADGWVVQTVTEGGERSSVSAKVVVNAAGLSAHHVFNHLLPDSALSQLWFAKGSYFSYKGPGTQSVSHLLYPCPSPSLAGLGAHLTLDLDGKIKFGPDVEWIKAPVVDGEEEESFWERHLNVDESEEKVDKLVEGTRRWLPGVVRDGFQPDYVGIRPKLTPPTASAAADFLIREEGTHKGFVNLMGIESPGLTSSLAIGEEVEKIVAGIWKREGRDTSS